MENNEKKPTRPVLLPAKDEFQHPQIPKANIKPVIASSVSKVPARSRLPTPRSISTSMSDASHLQTPRSYGAFGFSSEMGTSDVFSCNEIENLDPTTVVVKAVQFLGSGKKRPSESDATSPLPKKVKPCNSRVNSLKANKHRAARRSINNALKICQNKVAKASTATSSGYGQAKVTGRTSMKNPPATTKAPAPKRPTATVTSRPTNSRNVASSGVSRRPAKKPVPEPKYPVRSNFGNTSRNSSINTSRASSGSNTSTSSIEKKPKRKAWDLKGQVSDLKEELARSKQKESTITDILTRLQALEEEKHNISTEKTALSTEMVDLNAKFMNKDVECMNLKQKMRDIEDESRQRLRKLDMERDDLTSQLCAVRRSRDDLEQDVRKLKLEIATAEEEIRNLSQSITEKDEKITSQSSLISNITTANERLEKELFAAEADKKRLLNLVQELKGNIRVFCRVRPMLKKEVDEFGPMEHIQLNGIDGNSLAITNDQNKTLSYTFDKVFDATTGTQEKVFSEVSLLIESALDGYNVCIFAYGQTGAGKTYTMEGLSGKDGAKEGIIPRAMKLIFLKCKEKERYDWTYNLAVQHVEIYMETLQDLLSPSSDTTKLEIKTVRKAGQQQRIWVKNLTEHPISNFEQLYASVEACRYGRRSVTSRSTTSAASQVDKLLERSKSKRSTASTNANERSSRSHSVFILKISAANSATGEKFESYLNLIDLAGSERLAETGSQGVRLQEAQKINGSLSELSNVISALANKDSHVPFRNSKLTFLLMDSLGGKSKTLMVVNVNPTKRATGETINTLRFATTVNKCHIGTAQKVIKFD